MAEAGANHEMGGREAAGLARLIGACTRKASRGAAVTQSTSRRMVPRWVGTFAGASVALLGLVGCFPCEGVAVAFPDDPLVVGGTWEGVATSGPHPEIALLLVLDVDDVTPRSYAVSGQLELDGATLLQVEGGVSGFCEQRFVPSGAVIPATPAPEMPRFEATLYDETGARAGRLLTYRVHTPSQATETMQGHLWLERAASEGSYAFVVARR